MKNTPTTEKTTQKTEIPAWLEGAAASNVVNSMNLPGYTPYTGEGVAGLTPDQIRAFVLARENVGTGQAVSGQAVSGANSAMNFTAPNISTADVGANIQGLLNPYVNDQIDAATGALEKQRLIEEQRNGSLMARDKAFGGDRHGVVDAMANDDFETRKSSAITGLLSGSYNNALSTATDIAKTNASNNIAGAGVNLSGAQLMGNLGPLLQSLGINDVNTLLATGNVQQQNDQQRATFDYNEFLRGQEIPYKNLNATTQAIASAPHGTTSNGTTTKDSFSNPLAGMLGLGLGAFGLMSGNPMMAMSGVSGLLGGGGTSSGMTTNTTTPFAGVPGATTSYMGGIPYPMYGRA